jgi:hypothetical protein
MSDVEYVHVGRHADIIASGRPLGPGERVVLKDLHLDGNDGPGEDQFLIDTGVLVDAESFAGDAAPSNAEFVVKDESDAPAPVLPTAGSVVITALTAPSAPDTASSDQGGDDAHS